ncbi:FAD-dependent oxidoreductase [Cerasicoccus fimbriatus]|uniref:FAD-dependent oxidoreductase n=1 Tax=Cerasicoccus fimbriatus TaxID=3014554 RepID=UPI0022B572F0|nr:FAD-dependent oxidoreductase [Cerasicoccus sp. TK19100]
MKKDSKSYDVVVCGGGLAGFSAAIAAARHGSSTCLIQDRPVFGGNSSSEVRVTTHGAAQFHAYARESGILSEAIIEERARNHEEIMENGWTNSVWDLVLYDMAVETENLTCYLNTTVKDVIMADGSRGSDLAKNHNSNEEDLGYTLRKACNSSREIDSVVAYVANAEVELYIKGKVFIDCTGDALVADQAGCEWRMGTESKSEFGEIHAPLKASKDTMGNSIMFKAKDMGRPVPYQPPTWAVKHEDPAYFYEQGRIPYQINCGYWWIEIGVPWHTIYEAEDIRHELTRHCLGIWDWIKNHDPKLKDIAQNFALDWIGQVPGKRESRRVIGRYFLTENEIQSNTVFKDEIAYGGWFIDLHTPGGLLAATSEEASASEYADSEYMAKSYVGPYSIPLNICISKDVDNLMMAGRNVSASHAALGTVRVMGTTALMGQACGTAAARAIRENASLGVIADKRIELVQQDLLRDGCYLPNITNADPLDLARAAQASASSEAVNCGVGPDSFYVSNGLKGSPNAKLVDELIQNRAHWIAVGSEELNTIEVLLSNKSASEQQITYKVEGVDSIWDYRADTGHILSEGNIKVSSGENQWVPITVNLSKENGKLKEGFIRLTLTKNPEVAWHASPAVESGQTAAIAMSEKKLRRHGCGISMAFRLSPAQRCYEAKNVLSGRSRPYDATHLWRSSPEETLPQYIELAWDAPQTISTIILTFSGHLLREYHMTPTLYRDPQCAKDYTILALIDDSWETIVEVEGNYQRHRSHKLDTPVNTNKLKIVVQSTNGDPSAAVYEVRCYS